MTRHEAPFPLIERSKQLLPRTLQRPRIPIGNLIDVLVEDDDGELIAGDAGVNLALTDDPRGLVVAIPLWAGAQAFEEIDVHWGGSLALSHFISPGELDAPEGVLYLRVPLRRLLDGQAQVSYTVWHLDGNASESDPIRVLVKRTRPGGRDDDAEAPGHQGLVPAGLADELIENGIGPIEAAAGVEVTLAAYEHMRVRDQVELDWGGERLVHVVDADEVGQALTLVVEEALILAAGDGEIKLAWKVTDEVLNSSRDADERPWSASTMVEVHAGGAQLYPPYVKIRDEYVDEVIDLNALELDDVTVEVFTDPHYFEPGHWVELFWNGLTAEGEPVRHRQQAQVERVPGAVTFFVPNAQAQQLGGGRVVLYYQLKAGETTPPLHSSQRTTRRIEGEGAGIGLRAPSVLEAVGGHLDPSLAEATIQVVAYPGIKLGDELTVVFSGTRADGSEVNFYHTRNVTSGQIEDGKIERIVPGEYIAALDGRRAEVYYLVNGRRSETLGLIVGELQATLPAPRVLEVEEGVLDPANVGAQGATLEIPLYPRIALGDLVTYLWQGSEANGSTSDQSQISSLTEVLLFDVPKVFVEANLNGSVEVSYSVERDGHPGQMSQVYSFRVGVLAPELDAPTVVQAPGGTLDPLDATSGATVDVSYAGMAASDQITLRWRGTSSAGSAELGPFTGDASGTLLINIQAALVGANIGPGDKIVQVSYSVLRNGEEPLDSPALALIVRTLGDLPAPFMPDAVDDVLDLAMFSGNPLVKITPWTFMAVGQRVWLRIRGVKDDGSAHEIVLWTNAPVVQAELTNGLAKAVPRSQLLNFKSGSAFTIELKVTFDRSGDENVSVIFSVPSFTIKHALLSQVRSYLIDSDVYDMVLSPDNRTVYIMVGAGLRVLDVQTGGVRQCNVTDSSYRLAVDFNGSRCYVGCSDGIRVINLQSLSVTAFIPVQYGGKPNTLNSAGTRLYIDTTYHVGGVNVQKVSIIDTQSNRVIQTANVPIVGGGALSHDERHLYVTADGLTVLDAGTLSKQFSIPLDNYCSSILVSRDGRTLYAAVPNSRAVAVIDLNSRTASYFPVGNIISIALNAEGNRIFTASNWTELLGVYELPSGRRLQTFDGGSNPWHVVSGSDGSVYVSNRRARTIVKFQ
ncbi:YncE family protein [Pseudomonas rubra]|uniref:YncE family protein n=1 Tax=Pseudomonas rubra TaxID=2942627 RepID=A0ABT5PEA1_9PSED|nr:YncE family protein [Pseudomonas rubra]MDD1016338.1 YncE family protein [Pseudomonas rubra]MDD1037085.1 YncE family protein [Pseudomonas rubra]MDD1153746.1 YncE family protein [Pseudomonas rubra]